MARLGYCGATDYVTSAPDNVVQLWRYLDLSPNRRRAREKAQISGFGGTANRPAATAQPSRWRAVDGATALDLNIEMLPQAIRSATALRSRIACIEPNDGSVQS
jgi:hypothetical protein